MEGIVRQALEHQPPLDLVITHFVNPPMLDLLQQGQAPISIAAHESVAMHYGISTVNLAQEVAERIDSEELTWEEYGGTHPAEAGNALAAELVEDLLGTAWKQVATESGVVEHIAAQPKLESEGTARRLPKRIDGMSYDHGRMVNIAEAQRDGSWSLGRPDWSKIGGSLRARFVESEMLCAAETGAELKLAFEGTAMGLYVLAGPDAGTVEYSIDGTPSSVLDL
jgi:hypothetical protein